MDKKENNLFFGVGALIAIAVIVIYPLFAEKNLEEKTEEPKEDDSKINTNEIVKYAKQLIKTIIDK